MGSFTESILWGSMLWGAIGSGYLLYGWRQRSMMPFIGGLVMTAASCFIPFFPMTLFGIILIWGVWWLMKQGY